MRLQLFEVHGYLLAQQWFKCGTLFRIRAFNNLTCLKSIQLQRRPLVNKTNIRKKLLTVFDTNCFISFFKWSSNMSCCTNILSFMLLRNYSNSNNQCIY